MKIESEYNIGDKIVLESGEEKIVRGIHIYISDKTVGYHLHIGGAVFVSPKDVKEIKKEGGKNEW